jgi:hypothetical protein
MSGVLPALWSFLRHPVTTFEGHLAGLEERLQTLETRVADDLRTSVSIGVDDVEDSVAGAEHRLEEDLRRAIHGRVAGLQARLEVVKAHAVENLKLELRRMALLLALATGAGVLALLAAVFGLMATWTYLKASIGDARASLVLAGIFLLASIGVFVVLRSASRRTSAPPNARATRG